MKISISLLSALFLGMALGSSINDALTGAQRLGSDTRNLDSICYSAERSAFYETNTLKISQLSAAVVGNIMSARSATDAGVKTQEWRNALTNLEKARSAIKDYLVSEPNAEPIPECPAVEVKCSEDDILTLLGQLAVEAQVTRDTQLALKDATDEGKCAPLLEELRQSSLRVICASEKLSATITACLAEAPSPSPMRCAPHSN